MGHYFYFIYYLYNFYFAPPFIRSTFRIPYSTHIYIGYLQRVAQTPGRIRSTNFFGSIFDISYDIKFRLGSHRLRGTFKVSTASIKNAHTYAPNGLICVSLRDKHSIIFICRIRGLLNINNIMMIDRMIVSYGYPVSNR